MSTAYPLARLGFSNAPLPATVTFDLPEDAMRIYQVSCPHPSISRANFCSMLTLFPILSILYHLISLFLDTHLCFKESFVRK